MKLRRFLSLLVAAIMVLAMVPAMSVNAEETVFLDVTSIPGSGEQEISVAGWTKSENGAAVRWNQNWGNNGTWGSTGTYALMFFFSNNRGSSNGNVTAAINSASLTAGATKVNINFNFACQTAADLYQRWWFRDVDGNNFASFYFDKNVKAEVGMNSITQIAATGADVLAMRGTNIDITAEKNEAGTYTVTYKVAGEVKATETVNSMNGFGSIYADVPSWNQQWAAAGLQDLVITYEVPATIQVVEAQYTVNGEVVHTETGSYDSAAETGVTFPAYSYSANGSNVMYATDGATLSEDGTIELTAVTNAGTHAVGDIFAKDGVQYEIQSSNLVPNGDFAYGTAGWYSAANGAAGFFTANGDGTMTITAGGTGAGGANSLYRAWAIEKEKTYLFTFDATATNAYDKVSVKDDISATADGTVILNGAVAGTNACIFTAANDYVQVNFRWLGVGDKFGNFGLYEIAEAEVAIAETVASVDTIAGVTVIGDTTVVLPAAVAVKGSLGSEVNAPIVWDVPASYEVGTTTVEGTATVQFGTQDATEETVSTTVTVLQETFTIEDFNSVNGQDAAKANQKEFPVALTDTFFVEFVANYASFGDLFITLKTKDAGFFGPEQIALGANGSGAFRPVNGNGSGGRAVADFDHATLTTGKDYRFLVAAMPATNQYSVMVYDAATGVAVANAEYYGFRTNSGSIEVITALTNNGQGSIALSDIKVSAPGVEKTAYTVNITIDGETTTATQYYWSDEDALNSIADIEGYEKTVSIEGTTITVVYSATKVVTVTFVTADETVVYEVTEEVQLNDSVTVATKEIYDAVTCAYYTIPETVAETTTVVEVAANADKIAVVADAFHNSSDAQPWNNDDNMLFVGAAGVTNIDDVDANGDATHNGGGALGSSRVALVKFPVPEVAENKAVKLHLYVAKANQNLGNGSWMKIAANVSGVEANEVENAYVAGDLVNLDGLVWSDNAVSAKSDPVSGRMEVNEWVEIDVTNFVKAATGETVTFALYVPTAGFYVADREKAVVGGAYESKAAYLTLEDAFVVTETGFATLTKNGSAMTTAYAVEGDDIRLVASGAVVIGTDAGYVEANKNLNVTEATAFENTVPAGLGLAMVGGAQVRIGTTELEEGAKLDALADSGLRFIATADYADTVLADDAVEFGIKVQAEASDNVVYVEAETFQNEDNNVFSAAITNLKESNYNRKYTATAYAKVPMADGTVKEFTTEAVTRSIYQVSAGIMKNGTADADNAAYTVDGVVKNILNAYVNQTGIRLSYTADGIAVEDGKYTGDVFFTVESVSDGDDGYNVTITPDASWGTPAEIATWWMDYVRFNNNNSVAKGYISGAEFVDGALTFNFDTTVD